MIKNKVSDDFFKKAILKGKNELFNDFTPDVKEFKVGADNFFEISKGSIHKGINDRITKFILDKNSINSAACGFVSGKSYYDFLRPHVTGYYFLRLDIKKFFHSIPTSEIRDLLSQHFNDDKRGAKYSALDIAYISVIHKVSDVYGDIELKGKEILPMGFSSSPVISNIIFRRIDILIQKLCEDKGITYTRYADDMLFSSAKSRYLHSDQFEKDISIFASTLSLKLKKRKRKATENTISLNGYIIQNKKKQKGCFNLHKEDHIGKIRLSNKKLKIIKQLVALLRKQKDSVYIMENLFQLNFAHSKHIFRNNIEFYKKYYDDQLQNKIKGYRSYLVSLIKYDKTHSCVSVDCIRKATELVKVLELNIK